MLGYVALIALVIVAFRFLPGQKQGSRGEPTVPVQNNDPDAFIVRDEFQRPLDDDEFRSYPADGLDSRLPANASRDRSNSVAIDPQLLSSVQDNTLNIRSDEAPAFFYTLDRARQFTSEQMEQAAVKGVQFVNLMHDPALYRGKPVTIVGTLGHLREFQATDNSYGLTTLYDAWIMTLDVDNRPTRVVASSIDPGLSADERPLVKITGYFFKREGYHANSGQQVAPTILASRIERFVSPYAPPPADGLVPVVMGLVMAIGLILATTLISLAWGDRRSQRRPVRLPEMTQQTAQELASLDIRSIRDQLRELEEEARHAAWTPRPATPPPPPPSTSFPSSSPATPPEIDPLPDLPTPPPPTRPPRPSLEEY